MLILLGLVLSFIPAAPFMAVGKALPGILKPAIAGGLSAIGAPEIIISLICDAVINAVGFSIATVGFVAGVSLVFGFLEEIGYMARISYAFNDTMAKLGLQGKAMIRFWSALPAPSAGRPEPGSLIPGGKGY